MSEEGRGLKPEQNTTFGFQLLTSCDRKTSHANTMASATVLCPRGGFKYTLSHLFKCRTDLGHASDGLRNILRDFRGKH